MFSSNNIIQPFNYKFGVKPKTDRLLGPDDHPKYLLCYRNKNHSPLRNVGFEVTAKFYDLIYNVLFISAPDYSSPILHCSFNGITKLDEFEFGENKPANVEELYQIKVTDPSLFGSEGNKDES